MGGRCGRETEKGDVRERQRWEGTQSTGERVSATDTQGKRCLTAEGKQGDIFISRAATTDTRVTTAPSAQGYAPTPQSPPVPTHLRRNASIPYHYAPTYHEALALLPREAEHALGEVAAADADGVHVLAAGDAVGADAGAGCGDAHTEGDTQLLQGLRLPPIPPRPCSPISPIPSAPSPLSPPSTLLRCAHNSGHQLVHLVVSAHGRHLHAHPHLQPLRSRLHHSRHHCAYLCSCQLGV
mmetsp:Transcript_3239/g.7486  ORF Transcript_3239/g.7486 Transcript_3239/m.7486 type:complete len:239 (+) Transcript_3239:252-968(+)